MFKSKQDFFGFVKNKSVGIIGMGISHIPLIELLIEKGALITVYDKKSPSELGNEYNNFKTKGVKFNLGDDYLCSLKGDIIFKTPGIRFDNPSILKAENNGSIITSEMEVFFEICTCPIIAVTGSDGKTTTTTLISKIIEKTGKKCYLGGNIGTPLLPIVEKINENDVVVVELSSFQLQSMKKSPHIAVVTNISPNHLDYHKTYQEYIDAKKAIFNYQSYEDILVVNAENEITNSFADEAKGRVIKFSSKKQLDCGCYLLGGNLYSNFNGENKLLFSANNIKIPGIHNVENYLAAICATLQFNNSGASKEVATTFGGVEHRIEFVRSLNDISFYNSSIDSSPNRSIATLSVFDKKVIMICGGKDKGIPYDEIGPVILDKVKHLILIGATSKKIHEAVINAAKSRGEALSIKIDTATSYEEAVATAYKSANTGDVVVLSPASTSFDMFKNFEERGNLFKKIVMSLK